MFYSKLENSEKMAVYPPVIQKGLEWLRNADLLSMETGRYYIDGDDMFLNLDDMTTHPYEGSHPEVHTKYVDLMYWPEGGEKIGYGSYQGNEKIFEDHPENDIKFLESVENENFLTSAPGYFAVFFPWDAHRPSLMLGDAPATTRKGTMKINIELF